MWGKTMQIKVRINKRRNSLFGVLAAIPIGLTVGIAAFSFSSDGYDMISLHEQNLKLSKNIEISVNVLAESESQTGGTATNGNAENVETVINPVTTGTGLNLLLINNIQTECFVKEYLTLCTENQNGSLDTTQWAKYASVLTTIGINISESGFYPAGDGFVLPKTDLPVDSSGAPIWDNQIHSLKLWNVNNHTSGGYSSAGGPFQYISGGALTRILTRSKYNAGTNTGGGIGDCYLFPDAVCGLNAYMGSAMSWIGGDSSVVSDVASGVATVVSHNRGVNGLYMVFGVPYDTILHKGNPANYVDKSKVDAATISGYLDEIYNDAVTVPESVDLNTKASLGFKGYTMTLYSYIANGWRFSVTAGANAKQRYSAEAQSYWNQLFPDEQVKNAQEFYSAIDRHTSKLSDAVGLSDAECDRIYGTENGDYTDYLSSGDYGDIFKVSQYTSDAYNNGPGAKVVYSLEAICAEHVFNTFCNAATVYARMLKYAGVDVDPTKPSTYMNTYSETEWVPADNDVDGTLIAHGLDTTALNAKRESVVRAAANLVGIKYIQCRHFSGCDGACYDNVGIRPTHLDCSAFVWRAYADAGFSMAGFPTETGSYASSPVLEKISIEELKPGDMMVYRKGGKGHVEIYLGKNGMTFNFIEAFNSSKLSGYTSKNVLPLFGPNYSFYRYKGID